MVRKITRKKGKTSKKNVSVSKVKRAKTTKSKTKLPFKVPRKRSLPKKNESILDWIFGW